MPEHCPCHLNDPNCDVKWLPVNVGVAEKLRLLRLPIREAMIDGVRCPNIGEVALCSAQIDCPEYYAELSEEIKGRGVHVQPASEVAF